MGLVVACGARSGDAPPDDATETETETETDAGTETDTTEGVEVRLGSCKNPYILGYANKTLRGRLLGRGDVEGWCSSDGNDRGREDVYVITTPVDIDVVFLFREETDFPVTLRVDEGTCDPEAEAPAETEAVPNPGLDAVSRFCEAGVEAGAWRSFYARAGVEYYVTIDSPRGTDGRYGFDLLFGDPPIDACALHPSKVKQSPGGVFQWSNDFAPGQGRVDGPCAGPGPENMFEIEIEYPGYVEAEIKGDFVANFRSACGGASELECIAGNGVLVHYFDTPGTYYLVIDQVSHESAGNYSLQVRFQ
ncbi:MAG: hypothetical protein R3A51_00200 [Nannocystaceae bacterium]|nr:hypothetical protein [Myxococcales bacterium]